MAVYNVKNAQQLQSALGLAIGGDRIVLAAGDYGTVSITGRNYASAVTIVASSTANRAHLDGLNISKSSNLLVSGLDLGRGLLAGEEGRLVHLNSVKDSSNITFKNVVIHGSRDDDPSNDGHGLTVTRASGFRIEASDLSDLIRGLNVQQSSNVTVLSNKFDTLRSDGITVAATNGILIDRNSFTDIRPIGDDHADAIQFWNTGQTVGSSNITIRNNVIAPGGDDYAVQGIFISDPGTFGYQNVKITNNLIYSHGAYHGISVTGATSLQVVGNSLLSQTTDTKRLWIQLNNSKTVTLSGNVADDILLNNVTGLTQGNNHDLSNDPFLRTLINADSPASLLELTTPGVGFQAPVASAALTALTTDATAYLGAFTVQAPLAWQFDSFAALP